MKRLIGASALGLALLLGGAGAAVAQTDNGATNTQQSDTKDDNSGKAGLLGLLGLFGLAGLAKRDRKDDNDSRTRNVQTSSGATR